MILCLVIFVLTITSFLWGKISMGLTALLSMVLLVLTGCIDITTALSGFSNSNTIIMACMFIISGRFLQNTDGGKALPRRSEGGQGLVHPRADRLHHRDLPHRADRPQRDGGLQHRVPAGARRVRRDEGQPSKIMFSIGIVAISTVTALPIGAGAVYPAQYNGLLENLGAGAFQFKFWDVGRPVCRV